MNLIPMIAKELGVEIGERFYIGSEEKIEGAYYYFSSTELLYHVPNRTPDYAQYRDLADLIYGDKKIIKLPFEPKRGEEFYKVYVSGDKLTTSIEIWADYLVDYALKYFGNCFRTEAEAEKHKFKIYEKLTGRKWEEK